MVFTDAEYAYLAGHPLGRLATIGPDGAPQVHPVAFWLNDRTGTIDVGGPALAALSAASAAKAGLDAFDRCCRCRPLIRPDKAASCRACEPPCCHEPASS
jgi:hypothetical protein